MYFVKAYNPFCFENHHQWHSKEPHLTSSEDFPVGSLSMSDSFPECQPPALSGRNKCQATYSLACAVLKATKSLQAESIAKT